METKTGRQIAAAMVDRQGGDFQIRSLELESPRRDEVLVRIVATGMCHTDIAVRDGVLPTPLPAVLGHEGAGVVMQVGEDVRKVVPGDHVVLTFLPCRRCVQCLRGIPASCENLGRLNFGGAREDGSHALCGHSCAFSDRFFGQSSFSTYALASEANVVNVRKDAPLELLGPLGCGIQTGAGTVLNDLRIGAGSTIAVFGTGAVGLSGVMAAHLAGAVTIVAVDVVPHRLKLALELGATHAIDGRDKDVVTEIRRLTDQGVEFSLDTTGIPAVTASAIEALRPMGRCAFVGASPAGSLLTIDLNDLMNNNKSVAGVIEGRSVPDVFIPKLVNLYMQGRFPFDRLVKFYDFDEINVAAADSYSGETVKPILRMPVEP